MSTMLVFISGSINSGKSTTAKLLAEKLGAEFIDFDDLRTRSRELEKDIPKVFEKGIQKINQLAAEGKSVVTNYVIRPEDYEMLQQKLKVDKQYYFTLAPRLEVVLSHRGRRMSDWEYERVKYHYATGIPQPPFGEIIDNSDMSVEETAEKIMARLAL